MVVDAAFTSIGLNYFTSVVPKVEEFSRKFVESGRIKNLKELAAADINELREVWKNRRSWAMAKGIASHLSTLSEDDKLALRTWATNARLENWWEDPIGKIKGVGLVTFQYLRMMGCVDTVMPDKIVKRIVNGILVKVGLESLNSEQGICFGRWVMGEALFRGGCLENRETKTLFRTFISMLVVFVIGMFILGMFVFGILLAYSLPYLSVDFAKLLPILMFLGSLCFVSGVGLIVKAGVLAIRKGRIGNIGQKGYSSRVVAEAYRKPWKLVG